MWRYFDQKTETLPHEKLVELQLHKLQAMVAELYGRNRFYTSKWQAVGFQPGDLKSLADLPTLPMTTKAELVSDQVEEGFAGTNLTYPLAAYTRYHQTSGTTGKPLRVLDTVESWDWWGRCWGRP